jgi:hypothetical protein
MWKRIVCLFSDHEWGRSVDHEIKVTVHLHHSTDHSVVISERTCERCGKKEAGLNGTVSQASLSQKARTK